jgi:hypothetical protein
MAWKQLQWLMKKNKVDTHDDAAQTILGRFTSPSVFSS